MPQVTVSLVTAILGSLGWVILFFLWTRQQNLQRAVEDRFPPPLIKILRAHELLASKGGTDVIESGRQTLSRSFGNDTVELATKIVRNNWIQLEIDGVRMTAFYLHGRDHPVFVAVH